MDKTSQFVYVGFWKRALVGIIDTSINVALSFTIFLPLTYWTFEQRNIIPATLLGFVWMAIWSVFLVVRFGGTPGKLLLRMRIVDNGGDYLGWAAAIRRIIPGLIIAVLQHAQLYMVINNYPGFETPPSLLDIGMATNEYGGVFTMLARVSSFFIYIDVGTIIFNKKKRAIHDFLAGSYVITKPSYLAVKTGNFT